MAYGNVGRFAEAVKLSEEALAFRKRVLHKDHPSIPESMNNVAKAYADVGRRGEALAMQEKVLAFFKRVLPTDHPDIATSMSNVAVSHHAVGNSDKVRAVSRSISPPWGSIRFRLALRTYAPWGVRVVSQTKSRKIPTRKFLPLFFASRRWRCTRRRSLSGGACCTRTTPRLRPR